MASSINFGFLKDPVLVNAIFLKKHERIEALGLILVISLLLWRLIELTMRQHLEQHQSKLPGWNKRPTERPTTFMMTTKFESIQVSGFVAKGYWADGFRMSRSSTWQLSVSPVRCSPNPSLSCFPRDARQLTPSGQAGRVPRAKIVPISQPDLRNVSYMFFNQRNRAAVGAAMKSNQRLDLIVTPLISHSKSRSNSSQVREE